MANDEVIGPRKTMFVLVIVVGCFAVLWPRILSPLVLGPTREQIQPNQFDREAGCCEVIFETDVALLELVNEVCHSAWGVGKLSAQSAAECRKVVNDTCGVDIAVFLKRNENVGKTTKMLVETMQSTNSSCLRENFGIPIYNLGHHLAANWNIKDTLKQERAPPIRGMGPHPALRERGRAIPPGPPGPPPPPTRPVTLPPHIRVRSPLSVYYEDGQPPPIPGMRPPLGSPGGPVPAPKSSMGFVMPIYTICIIVFFVYTLTKIMFRRQGPPYDPVAPDPQFRRRVFRDDSRSSPEKLGKKEADMIVTAISGLVAEVQQQMEASGAPNQQRQDVQDNARPYTNGTILLNSGPVQIVTSEYKEASKEKTPEPVTEKESTPGPKEAEATKVVTESSYNEDESISGTKESLPELEQPSPESGVTQEEYKATPESVVVRKSSPEPSVTEDCEKSSRGPELAKEPISEPISNPSLAPSVTEVAKEFILEPTSELKESTAQLKESTPEVFQVSAPKSNLNLVEAIAESEVSKYISLPSDSKEILSELNESNLQVNEPLSEFLTELAEPIAELKTLSQEPTGPICEPKKSSPEPKSTPEPNLILSEFEKLIDPKDHTLEFNELVPDLKESSPPPGEESSPKAEEILIESKEPTLNDLILDPLPSTIESQETSSEPERSIIQSKELSIESESSLPKKSPLTSEPIDPSSESKEPILEPICPSKDRLESEDSESNISSLNIKESVAFIPEHQTITEDIDQSIPKHKESSTHKESTLELIENSQEIKAPIVERSPESKFVDNSPEIEAPILESSTEPKLTEHSPEIEARVVERSPETEHSAEIDTESLKLKEPTPQSNETTPERKLTEESNTIQIDENTSVSEGTLLDLEEAIADEDARTEKQEEKQSKESKTILQDQSDQSCEELLKKFESTKAANDIKDDLAKTNDQFLQEERFVLVRQGTPDAIREKLDTYESKPAEDCRLYTEPDEEDLENATVKVMGMEMTAHPADGGEWPRDERPPPPVSPPPRAPHAAEEVKSIFLETEIPQQSRVLVAQFEENRPPPAAHSPLVVSGKMTLSLIQDAPRDTPERDLESTLDEFTTASAVTQPAAEKGEMESDEEIEEEIEVEEIELEEEEETEEEEEEEEPLPVKAVKK